MPHWAGPHLARLQGDFFCAPFAARSDDGSPFHGWTANADWVLLDAPPGTVRAVLRESVQGATVVKELSVADDHPFLYQRHVFIGGSGSIPVANHANISLPTGGLLAFSPKRWFETTATQQEPDPSRGRSQLLCPARADDPHAFPLVSGATADLTRYPWGDRHEDFVAAVEAEGSRLGWTAVVRVGLGDLYLSLRDPRVTPMTMLWHSNGGRDYSPWSGRHRACLGIEEGAALGILGISSTESPDPLTASGFAPALRLAPFGATEVRHVIGAIAWPTEEPVDSVNLHDGTLVVRGAGGAERRMPFHEGFLTA
jgi:hypothetical protein